MKKQLNGIILVLFGILLCLASNELNTIFNVYINKDEINGWGQ